MGCGCCGCKCPSEITLRFHDVQIGDFPIGCGCVADPDGVGSSIASDIGLFNDIDLTVPATTLSLLCTGCPNTSGCDAFSSPPLFECEPVDNPQVGVRLWTTLDCSGDPFFDGAYQIEIEARCCEGTWGVTAIANDNCFAIFNAVIFYGFSTDPSSITNLAVCGVNPDLIYIDDCTAPFIDVTGRDVSGTLGTASITF